MNTICHFSGISFLTHIQIHKKNPGLHRPQEMKKVTGTDSDNNCLTSFWCFWYICYINESWWKWIQSCRHQNDLHMRESVNKDRWMTHCTVSLHLCLLRLPYRNDAEIAKFCDLWTFWPVIQLINHLFKIRQFQKDGLLAELQAKTSKGCRILLFQHHSYMVTLSLKK